MRGRVLIMRPSSLVVVVERHLGPIVLLVVLLRVVRGTVAAVVVGGVGLPVPVAAEARLLPTCRVPEAVVHNHAHPRNGVVGVQVARRLGHDRKGRVLLRLGQVGRRRRVACGCGV